MRRLFRSLFVAVATATLFLPGSVSLAQPGDGGGGGGGGGGGNNGGGGGPNINFAQPIAGVDVDAKGVLKVRTFDPRVARERLMAARQQRGNQLMRASELRKVS